MIAGGNYKSQHSCFYDLTRTHIKFLPRQHVSGCCFRNGPIQGGDHKYFLHEIKMGQFNLHGIPTCPEIFCLGSSTTSQWPVGQLALPNVSNEYIDSSPPPPPKIYQNHKNKSNNKRTISSHILNKQTTTFCSMPDFLVYVQTKQLISAI